MHLVEMELVAFVRLHLHGKSKPCLKIEAVVKYCTDLNNSAGIAVDWGRSRSKSNAH